MTVLTRKGAPPASLPTLVFCPRQGDELIVPLCPIEESTSVALHWCPELRATMPCTSPSCRICPAPIRWAVYLPVLHHRRGKWAKAVLHIPEHSIPEGGTNFVGTIHRIKRATGSSNAHVSWISDPNFSPTGRPPNVPVPGPFDVMPSLERFWSLAPNIARRAQS